MFTDLKRYHVFYDSKNAPYLLNEDDRAIHNPFGWIMNDGPPHDHNWDYRYDKETNIQYYLESWPLHDRNLDMFMNDNGDIIVVVEKICPNYNGAHINKDCSCKTGFIIRPKMHEEKLILLYKEIPDKIRCYFH